MTLEELAVVFTADAAPFIQAAEQVRSVTRQTAFAADRMADEFADVGRRAAEGLAGGLYAGKNAVAAAAKAVADAAAGALRTALQIHSPSRVTLEMGRQFDRGFLEGLMEEVPQVERESHSLAMKAASALEGSAPQRQASADHGAQAAPVHLTVPLEIDGYRLGMCVIENINRITGSTGRLELTL